MACSFKLYRSRLGLNCLQSRGYNIFGQVQRRSAARWGWMKTAAAQESEDALQRVVDFCCTSITNNQDRLDAASEARLVQLLENVSVQAFGFHDNIVAQPDEGAMGSTSVSYMHVAEKEGCFSMGVFLFKNGSSLPLHDHPAMSVYSRTLFGTIDACSFDWLSAPPPPGGEAAARLTTTRRLTPGSVTALYADSGNVHSFRALSPAAVFDILIPGYCYGRECTYFARSRDAGGQDVLQDSPGIGPAVRSTPYPGYRPAVF